MSTHKVMHPTNIRPGGAGASRSERVRFIIRVSRDGLDERRNAGKPRKRRNKRNKRMPGL